MKLKTENEISENEKNIAPADVREDDGALDYLYDYQITTPEQCIEQLEFHRDAYRKQKEGAEFRLYQIRFKKNVWVATVVAMFLVCVGLISLSMKMVMGFLLYSFVAFVMAMVAFVHCIKIMILSVYSYGVHYEKPKFEKYIKKHDIFTLQDEMAHCDMEIMKLGKMIDEVKALDGQKIERKYFEYRYINKYSTEKVCYFFDEHSSIFIVGMIGLVLAVTIAAAFFVIIMRNGILK